MRLGVHCSVRGGLTNALEEAARLGCETLQLFTKSPRVWRTSQLSDEEAARFRTRRRELKLDPIVVHTPYLPNLCTSNPILYQRSELALHEDLVICERIAADFLVIHPGAYSEGETAADGVRRFGAAMNRALAARPGRTMILLENMAGGGRRLGSALEELAALRDAVEEQDRIGFCLDTAHTLAAGFPLSNAKDVDRTLAIFDRVLGKKNLKAVHANDSKAPLGARRDLHQHIGQGHIGLEGFRALVKHPTLRSLPFILETPKDAPEDDPRNLKALRSLDEQRSS